MRTVVVPLLVLALLVLVPLGLPLLATPGAEALRRVWPWAGLPAAVALLLPVGGLAALLTVPYLLLCAVAAGVGVRRAVRVRAPVGAPALAEPDDALRELLALTALASLPVAAGSLTAERAGYVLLGFEPDVLLLTVAHFHYTGFAVALLAGLALLRSPGPLTRAAAAAVPLGTAVVGVGHLLGRGVELAGTVVLVGALLALSGAVLREHRPGPLLVVSALTAPLTMLLALWWALGRVTGLPHLDLAATAATHGLGNALGVCLCGLLGRRLLRPERV